MHPPIVAAEQIHSTNLGNNSFAEDTISVCSSDYHVPPFSPAVGLYPSPYRVSTAVAFADINRALDVRSLRNSVYTNFEADQATPRSSLSPRPSLGFLSLSTRRATSSPSGKKSNLPDDLGNMRSHSSSGYPQRVASSETESEKLQDGDSDMKCAPQTCRTMYVVPGDEAAITKGQTKYFLSKSRENWVSRRKGAHKSTGARAADFVVTSPNGKRSSKRTRAVDCVIM